MYERNGNGTRRALRVGLSLVAAAALAPVARAATNAPVSGEIQRITIDNPSDVWSGGTIVVGGQVIIVPRNLLIDLPANRLTLQQLYAQAPAACVAARETGLAKGDTCNTSGMGGFATVAANRTNGGNVIAGDLFVQKGIEAITGTVTYVDYADGYFRLNGTPGNRDTGVMVRLNDPDARHTIQAGRGCAGGPNCSPDPRFTLDPDNYTNVFSTGYPLCIPSTTARAVPPVLGLGVATTQAAPDGSGDALCPFGNRGGTGNGPTSPPPVNGSQPVADSRRFAPILVGDPIGVEGNWEVVNGVRFLSAHSTMVGRALSTQPGQPDYLFLDEVEVDVAGFQNERARTLIIGYATLAPADVLVWSVHYDPATNAAHEFPLASVQGCDNAAGPGTCGTQGIVGAGANIFKIRHDVDFLLAQQTGQPASPRLSPCAHLRADPRFAALNVCPSARPDGTSTLAEELSILSPAPREIQARTGNSLANPGLLTFDVSGNPATNGQYLFPFGMGLGGIATPEFNEINLDALGTPFIFDGLPWALDRRLSPGGCVGTCEAAPQPLDPFPFGGLDPRTQAATPQGPWFDPNYTATPLSVAIDRVLSYVDGALGKFNGDATVLAWPPVEPATRSIPITPEVALVCSVPVPVNTAPVATGDSATTVAGIPVSLAVLANDVDPDGDPLVVTGVSGALGGLVLFDATTVTYAPLAGFTGADAFTYTIEDGRGGVATGTVNVIVLGDGNQPPVATDDTASTTTGAPVVVDVLANDTDPDGTVLTVVAVTSGLGGAATTDGASITYTPRAGFTGTDSFTYTVADAGGATATAVVTVAVSSPDVIVVTLAEFRINSPNEWRITGTATRANARITIVVGPTLQGTTLGTVTADALGAWSFRQRNATILPDATRTISLSMAGATRLAVPVTVRN